MQTEQDNRSKTELLPFTLYERLRILKRIEEILTT